MRKFALIAFVVMLPAQVWGTNFWAQKILRNSEARAGWEYLGHAVQAGYEEMRSNNVRSVVYPTRRIADLYPPWILKTVVVIEHTGEEEYRPDASRAVMRVFKVFARDREHAFETDQSSVGAQAMAQFMPGSYALMQERYPDARLPEFWVCMRNHECQVRAMLCHFDAGRVPLSPRLRRRLERRTPWFAQHIAAAYNAGGDQAARAVRSHPDSWFRYGYGLPHETRGYLWKFRRAQLPIYALDSPASGVRHVTTR